jgi:signal transduction histidine kinase
LTPERFDKNHMKYLPIKVKLIILTLITLIPLTILQAFNIHDNFQRSTEQKLQASVEIAHAVSKSFLNYIDEIWIQQYIISRNLIDFIDDSEKIQSYLNSLIDIEETALQRVAFINPEGIIIASTREYMIGQSLVQRDYYQRIIAGEDKVISNLMQSYIDGIIMIPVARAIKNDGVLVGIVVSTLYVDKSVSHVPELRLNEGDILTIVDSNGRMVYHSLNNHLSFDRRSIPEDSSIWKALGGELIKNSKVKTNFDDSYRMSVEYPIHELGWVCSVSSKRSVVLKDTYIQALQSIITLIIVTVISLIAAKIFGDKIAKPLVQLKEKADELKKGNYSVRTNIAGKDEIAATAEAFNLMADGIEQYDKLKNQFFCNLSHEFKTPINVIYSSVQLIESFENTLDPKDFKVKTLKTMSGIRQNCYRLMKLVDNMIDVSRYDAGHFTMELYNIDIVSVIENTALSVVKYAEQKGITIVFDTEMEEKMIYCNPYMIERVILNLISNSIKFTDAGGFIYVDLYEKENGIVFSVRDTGIGMAEDKLSIIFDRFRQIDTSLNRNHEGSGLGLSIVKALVEAHRGTITVKSKLGQGTEFTMELPVEDLCENIKKETDDTMLTNDNDTIQKIEIEFSDIYR